MKNRIASIVSAGALALLAGCFTVSETEFPEVAQVAVPGNVKVQLEGFQASVIDLTPVCSTAAFVEPGPGWHGPHHHHHVGGPYVGTYTTATYVPTIRNTDVFLQRASSNLEKAGCVLRASPAKYTVSAQFGGPVQTDADALKSACVFLCSLLTARSEALTYSAEVKVYETATGKMVFSQNYRQEYAASGWALIPLFGIMEFEKVQGEYMKSWCLAALTDRITADVTAFLTQNASQNS